MFTATIPNPALNGRQITSNAILPQTLIFEAGHSGHRIEYVTHLMEHINNSPSLYNRYVFALSHEMKNILGLLNDSSSYKIISFDFATDKNSISRSFYHWKLLSNYISTNQYIREMLFMEIDPYLLLLSTPAVKKTKLAIKGILFQPYIHFAGQKKPFQMLRNKYKNLLLQKLATFSNNQIRQLFILNDKSGVAAMNQNIQDVFRFLADPIQPGRRYSDLLALSALREKYNLQNDKKLLLIFGGIDKRKNIPTVIDAIKLLPPEIKGSTQLLIAGKFHPEIKQAYTDYITKHQRETGIQYFDGFVPDEERDALFVLADTVIMVYRDFYSSSGIMGHVMKYGKKVVVSDKGLMKGMANDYKLALTANPESPMEISSKIRQQVTRKAEHADNIAEDFVRAHSPYNFSKTLLQTTETR